MDAKKPIKAYGVWPWALPFTFTLGPYGAPWGPMGEQKYPQILFLRKEFIFNLFQKSGMLLKPKYLDFGAMRNLGILA